MELTGIGRENEAPFAPLMGGKKSEDYALCVGAIEEGEAAGVAFFSELADSLFLDYIFVSEKFRRRGIGSALIEKTIEALDGSGLVALHINYPESAADIHGLILSLGFKTFRDGTAYRTKVGDFLGSAVTKKLLRGRIRNRVVRIKDLNVQEKKALKRAMEKHELDPSCLLDKSLSEELSLANFEPESSTPAGLVLCHSANKIITISYLVNFSDDPVQLMEILKALLRVGESLGIEEHELLFLTMNDDMVKLPEKLLMSKDLLKRDGAVISGIRMLLPERTIFANILKEIKETAYVRWN